MADQVHLICELCHAHYIRPRMLPCLHSFCEACLVASAFLNRSGSSNSSSGNMSLLLNSFEFIEENPGSSELEGSLELSYSVPEIPSPTNKGKSKELMPMTPSELKPTKSTISIKRPKMSTPIRAAVEFSCPTCRIIFMLPDNGILGLPLNYYLYNQATSTPPPNKELCEICDKEKAETFCLDCRQHFCMDCQRGHKRARSSFQHMFVDLNKLENQDMVCPDHPTEFMYLFCSDCSAPLCIKCIETHEHQTFSSLTQVESPRASLTLLLDSVQTGISNQIKLIENLDQDLIDMKGQDLTEEIKSSFEKYIRELQTRQEDLIEKYRKMKKAKEDQLTAERNKIEEQVTQTAQTYSIARDVIENASAKELFLMSNRISTTLNDVKYQLQDPIKSAGDRGIGFVGFNAPVLSRVISSFGGISSLKIAPKKSYAFGSSLKRGKTGARNIFTIVTLTSDGSNFPAGGCSFEILFNGPSTVEYDIYDNNDGTYKVSYAVKEDGLYIMIIKIHDIQIEGSPFELPVTSSIDYKSLEKPIVQLSSKNIKSSKSKFTGFNLPYGLTYDSMDRLIVSDTGNHRILILDLVSEKLIRTFGKKGSALGEFDSPFSVTTSPFDDIIVADTDNHRVQAFDKTGNFLFSFGKKGKKDGEFQNPIDITYDYIAKRILVSDFGNNRVQVFDSRGRFIFKFGSQGIENGNFQFPVSVRVDQTDRTIFVSDHMNSCIQVFNPNGGFIRKFGVGNLSNPRQIAIDRNGHILVTDWGTHTIQIFKRSGELITNIGFGHVSSPSGLAIDTLGKIAVSDVKKNIVLLF